MSIFRYISSILITFALLFNTTYAQTPPPPAPATVTVRMTTEGFVPSNITINKGDTVVFQNDDSQMRWPASNLHPTHTLYPEFDPKQGIAAGQSWQFTFQKAGTWKYHDHIFPQYSGTVIVNGTNDTSIDTPATDTENTSWWVKLRRGIRNFFYRLTHWGKARPVEVKNEETSDTSQYNLPVAENSEEIFSNDQVLGSYLKKYGAKQTITSLRLLEPKFGSCHQPAHKAGRMGLALFGDKVFIEYSAECQSGYYHGALEEYLKQNGSGNLNESLANVCKGGTNDFFEHQCFHGIGHGLMAWANYELPEALQACDGLPRRKDSCWTGVFMENLVAKPAEGRSVSNEPVGATDVHYTKYLNSDPQYPCNSVGDVYKSSCYFLQTSRMLQIYGADFKKVAEACSDAPQVYQASCFGSMGRDVGGSYPKDMQREITECRYVTDNGHRIECLNGAVQNSFWDPSGQNLALEFCRLLADDTEKSSCYTTIFSRAPEVISSKDDLERFCSKAESQYQSKCRQQYSI